MFLCLTVIADSTSTHKQLPAAQVVCVNTSFREKMLFVDQPLSTLAASGDSGFINSRFPVPSW